MNTAHCTMCETNFDGDNVEFGNHCPDCDIELEPGTIEDANAELDQLEAEDAVVQVKSAAQRKALREL